jgi:hypothetical protein
MIHFSNNFVSVMLCILCCIAGFDLWCQYVSNTDDLLFYQYSMGIQASDSMWSVGFNIENMQIKLTRQQEELKDMLGKLKQFSSPLRKSPEYHQDFMERRKARNFISDLTLDVNHTVEIRCDMNHERLRVGSGNFHTDRRDMCMLYTGESGMDAGPHTMFDVIDLGDGTIGFKSLSNGMFVQAIPPASGQSYDPWQLGVKGRLPGANEKFRFSPEGYLYSSLFGMQAQQT